MRDYEPSVGGFRVRGNGYALLTETGVVPGSAYGYTVILDEVILEQGSLVVTDTTTSEVLSVVPYGQAVGVSEAGVNGGNLSSAAWGLPLVQVHSSREGHGLSVVYKPGGSAMSPGRLVEVVGRACRCVPVAAFGVWSSGAPHAALYLDGNGASSLTIRRLWVSSNDYGATDADTVLYVTTGATPAGGAEVTLLNGAGTATAVVDVDVDVSAGAWLNVFCTGWGGHQNLVLGVELE